MNNLASNRDFGTYHIDRGACIFVQSLMILSCPYTQRIRDVGIAGADTCPGTSKLS